MRISFILCKLNSKALEFPLWLSNARSNSAQVIGMFYFDKEVTLGVFETVDFEDRRIEDYSYEVHHVSEKIYFAFIR